MIELDKNYTFPEAGKLLMMLEEIREDFDSLLPRRPFLGVKNILIRNKDNPVTNIDLLPASYAIGITPTELLYNQIAYQFAHELCHVYIDPRITNWLIEAFCEALSLIILDRLYHYWQVNPSVTGMEWYAVYFKKYLDNEVKKNENLLGVDEAGLNDLTMVSYLPELNTPYKREVNFIAAWKIVQLFKSNQSTIHLVSYLHFTKMKEDLGQKEIAEETYPDIDRFERALPDNLSKIWLELKSVLVL